MSMICEESEGMGTASTSADIVAALDIMMVG